MPLNWRKQGVRAITLDRQFARSPYAVAFKRLGAPFILVTLHVYWDSKATQDIGERARELEPVATWLRSWASDVNSWDQNLICFGDFNIDRSGGTLWNACTSTGLTVPEQIDRPRVIAGKPLDHYYDQIAWFTADMEGTEPLLSLGYTDRAGMFDWSETVLADSGLTNLQKCAEQYAGLPLHYLFDAIPVGDSG